MIDAVKHPPGKGFCLLSVRSNLRFHFHFRCIHEDFHGRDKLIDMIRKSPEKRSQAEPAACTGSVGDQQSV